MSLTQRLVRAGLAGARGARGCSCAVRSNVVDNTKLKAKQAAFQKNDGLPVFLKGGASDRFLYYTTMTLSCVGLGAFVHLIYDLEYGEKE